MDDTTSQTDTVSATNDLPDSADVQAEVQTESAGKEIETSEDEIDSGEEESFFDPNNLPEELVPAYKQMQGAFTKKTQEIAEMRKEAEALREQASKAEEYAKYEEFMPVLDEMLNKQNTLGVSPEMVQLEKQLRDQGYSDEAIDMMKIGAQFTLNQFNQAKEQERQEKERNRIEGEIDKAQTVDPRLTDTSLTYQTEDGESVTFGQIVASLVKANSDWEKDPVTATKSAIKQVDAMLGKAKTDGKQELSNSAKNKGSQFPDVRTTSRTNTPNSAPKTIQEAAAEARAELGM